MLTLVTPAAGADDTRSLVQTCDGGSLAACRSGAADACRRLDAPADFFFTSRACDLRDAVACATLGDFYRKGIGTKQNYRLSRRYSTAACKAGVAMGCLQVGFLYNEGQGVAQSKQRARTFYKRACALGLPDHLQMVC